MKTRSLFISYRSSDATKVDKIAKDLSLLRFNDGTPRYITWQDKHNLPPASPSWWDAIVDAIIDSDIFVFNLSRASLQSEVCRAELDYAHIRNRPIVPVVLDGEFFLNAKSGKYELFSETWILVPEWLAQTQFIFFTGTDFFAKFQEAVEMFERKWPRDIPAARPIHPDYKSAHSSNHAIYGAACEYAERLAFADAEKQFYILVRRNDDDYADLAIEWVGIIRRYTELIEIAEQHASSVVFRRKWAAYRASFPYDFVESLFDPKGFVAWEQSAEDKAEQERINAERAERERLAAQQAEPEHIAAEKVDRERGLSSLESIGADTPQEELSPVWKSTVDQALRLNFGKLGPNDPCWCGSGKKYKNCHYAADRATK